jgi:hypothetical protein
MKKQATLQMTVAFELMPEQLRIFLFASRETRIRDKHVDELFNMILTRSESVSIRKIRDQSSFHEIAVTYLLPHQSPQSPPYGFLKVT